VWLEKPGEERLPVLRFLPERVAFFLFLYDNMK
jgi:hypothetical protein